MTTVVFESEQIHIPNWVVDLDSFRTWADSDDFPENGRICYLQGEVWVDMSGEQIFTHLELKSEFNIVLGALIKSRNLGMYLPDGLLLTDVTADISCKPDGTFVSTGTLREERVRLVEGKDEGYVEIEGSPDMVLKIVNRSSVHKDAKILFDAYWQAGILEYWIVDVRQKPIRFEILYPKNKGFSTRRMKNGWVKSDVFGQSFRLTKGTDDLGHPQFSLEGKE